MNKHVGLYFPDWGGAGTEIVLILQVKSSQEPSENLQFPGMMKDVFSAWNIFFVKTVIMTGGGVGGDQLAPLL